MTPFVYHRKVENLRGSVLYPLNQLKEVYPDLYEAHVQKYAGREHVLETRIPPPLDCLWNDVLHFTAVDPVTLYSNLARAGYNPGEFVHKEWFEVPVSLLEPEKTVACLYRRDVRLIPEARDFSPFNPGKMEEYAAVPEATIEYYKEQKALDRRPLFFHLVPHILFKGTIDTDGLRLIRL